MRGFGVGERTLTAFQSPAPHSGPSPQWDPGGRAEHATCPSRVAAERLGLVVALLAFLAPHPSVANCNVIPGTTNTFRAAMGELDGPFAMPGARREHPARVRLIRKASIFSVQ